LISHRNKILNLSTVDFGGAGEVAVKYNDYFTKAGIESKLIVKDSRRPANHLVYKRKLIHKFIKRIYGLYLSKIKFDSDYSFYNLTEQIKVTSAEKILKMCPFTPDIIILYWISDFINSKTIYKLQKFTGAKIYWLLIDNAPITGGCHYPWSCNRYQLSCENCPAILSDNHKNFAKKNLRSKLTHLTDKVTFVALSENDYQRVKISRLGKLHNYIKVLLTVDQNLFNSGDKVFAKNYWKIPIDKKVIFWGASDLSERRKGTALLIDAVNSLSQENILLLVAGNIERKSISHPIMNVGFLSEKNLIKAYQAADVFVCPSIEDSGPMMINQSIMCGTPVVAFDMGVAKDLVHTGKTGYRAILGNSYDLAKGLKHVLEMNKLEYNEISTTCRNYAIKMIGNDVFYTQIKSFLN